MHEAIDRSRSALADLRELSFPHDARELNLARSLSLVSLRGLSGPSLEKLTLNGCAALRELEGIQGAPHLRELHARGCTALSDVGLLAELPLLETIDLAKTAVTDLRPLARLPALARLDLSGSGPIDLSPLIDAPALRVLVLADSAVRTRDVPRVLRSRCARTRREIEAARARPIPIVQIEDLEPGDHTAALRRLFAAGSLLQARELARLLGPHVYPPLFSGASYRSIGLDGRRALPSPQLDEASLLALLADAPSDCEPADRLRAAIDRLDVASALDVADLECMPHLRELYVRGGAVRRSRSATLASLRFLRLDRAPVTDLAWLPALPALERLLLFDTPLRALDGIERAPALRELVLFRVGAIRDLSPLGGCASLSFFSAYQSALPSLAPLAPLPVLRSAWITGCGALDLTALRAAGIEVRE